MGVFKGRAVHGADDGGPDEALPFLSAGSAARVRALLHAAFAERGIETTVHATHLASGDGQEFGLWNVAAKCAQERRSRWPRVVGQHADSLIAALQAPDLPPLEELDEDFLLRHVHLRVAQLAQFAEQGPPRHARRLTDDLVELLAIDLPTSVAVLPDVVLDRVPLERLRLAGLDNLLADPVPKPQNVDLRSLLGRRWSRDVGLPRTPVIVLEGATVFLASHVLTMPDLLRRSLGDRATPDGVLVAVPARDVVLLHVVEPTTAAWAAAGLARLASSSYATAPGGLFPHVLWWHDARLDVVARVDDEGGVEIDAATGFDRFVEEDPDQDADEA